jgi:NAD(P) transhydrogenase subunit beta
VCICGFILAQKPAWLDHAQDIAYLVAAVLFAVGLKMLASPRSARQGNTIAAIGMLIAIVATLYVENVLSFVWIVIAAAIGSVAGAIGAIRIQMTAMPQFVALFNGFGGLASLLVAVSEYARRVPAQREWMASLEQAQGLGILIDGLPPGVITMDQGLTIGLSILIGGVTFTGSMIAFAKLQGLMAGRPRIFKGQLIANIVMLAFALLGSIWLMFDPGAWLWIVLITLLGSALGVTLTIAVGGADMPVMVALLNSYSGMAACATGFVLAPPNKALIVSGSLVGASGIILTMIMCKAMNRSLANVLFGGVGTDDSTGAAGRVAEDRNVRTTDPEDLAIMLDGARKVIIVPGYGMAVSQAQHAVRDLFNKLEARGCKVYFAIHPVAGRMPGHMNVLLAEVDIPYDRMLDLEQSNAEVQDADLALVIGANDVVNPAARHDTKSPIYGMPIIDVDKATVVVVSKRSLGAGYAGVENELFFMPNTLMFFGDAKKMMTALVGALH